jgi:hypothetical protein
MAPALSHPRPGRVGRRLACAARASACTALAAALLAALARTALASVSITSFSVTPSTTQAGLTSSDSGPNLNIDAKFSSSGWDTPDDATISLAPGLLANPQDASKCSAGQFQFNLCPRSSWIGSGWTTATAPGVFGFTLPFATNAYLVQPLGSEPARIGLIVNFFGWPVESATAPVFLRTTPGNVGLNIDFAGLPNLWNGISVVIDDLNITLQGRINGQPFTRNPTDCADTATSQLAAVSYGSPGSTVSASSSFTPTGCQNLGFNPQFANAVQLDSGDPGLAYGAQVTENPFDAATRKIVLTTPPDLSPLGALKSICPAGIPLSRCPAVGTATVTTPILPNPVTGKIVLAGGPAGQLPKAALLFSDPFPAEIDGNVQVVNAPTGGQQLITTFDTLPDVPLSNLIVVFNGGSYAVFVAGSNICTAPQPATAVFTAFDGATATQTANAQVMGCPSSASATAAVARLGKRGAGTRSVRHVPAHLLAVVRHHAGR